MSDQIAAQEPAVQAADTSSIATAPVQPVATTETPVVPVAPSEAPAINNDLWKEDFRKEIGEDKKLLSIVDKYTSRKDLVNSNYELQKKLSSTRALPELPQNATPEQLKEYREAAGIPNDPKGYELDLEIPENYKAGIEDYLKVAHENNRPANLVKASISDYLKLEAARQEQIDQFHIASEKQAESSLKETWGPRYTENKAVLENFFNRTFGDESDNLLKSQLPDGTLVGNNAKLLQKLLDVSKNTLGAATIIPNGMIQNDLKNDKERLGELEKMSQSRTGDYWGPNHEQYKAEMTALETRIAAKR